MTTLVPKFEQTNSTTNRAFSLKLQETISVLDFGADPTGVADSSTAVQAAIDSGKQVYFPKGTYKFNVIITNKTIIYGDGSTASIVKANNTATAIMTYRASSPYWTYHSEIRDLGFSSTSMVGVGFTFGQTNPANYVTGDEYYNNVKFYGCDFTGLNKGVQFPFGNIGTEFYSCGFQSNKYGVYTLNNKFGAIMHAGNKYFYSGEFSGNECAVYINNTADGFGAISFTDTIFEQNNIATYCYNSSNMITPLSYTNVWFEGNGSVGSYPSTTIDLWTGTTQTTQTLTAKTIIIDGAAGQYTFDKSFFADINVIATNVTVLATNCRSEQSAGYNGGTCTVASATSSIRLISPTTDGSMAQGDNITASGFVTSQYIISNNVSRASGSKFDVLPRSAKQTQYGNTLVKGVAFTSPETTSGSFGLTGTVVADGQIYMTCNEFTRAAFLSNQYTAVDNTSTSTSAGWYVYTFDVKVTAGAPLFYVWDRSNTQFSVFMSAPTLNKWYSFASIGQSTGASSLYLDVSGDGGICTWRLSAYQLHRFDTFNEAQAFLASGVYADTSVYTVAFLPAIATVPVGTRLAVTDATATTFASNVVGGGANKVPVYSDGTNWKIG